MSSFRKSAGILLRWKHLAILRTDRKLSCILLFLMKALCVGEIIVPMCGASLRARVLVMILVKGWMRLIGLKSSIDSAPSFFGSRTMLAVLIRGRLPVRRLWNALAASITNFRFARHDACLFRARSMTARPRTVRLSFWRSVVSLSESGRSSCALSNWRMTSAAISIQQWHSIDLISSRKATLWLCRDGP
jgi:hypothetical protein